MLNHPLQTEQTSRGFTVEDLASRYRVSPDKIRAWIRANLLRAINTADIKCSKPRYVITPESLAEFERCRSAGSPPKQARKRRSAEVKDYYPD